MIQFKQIDNKIIATYSTKSDNIDWLFEIFKKGESYAFQKTFTFSKIDLLHGNKVSNSKEVDTLTNVEPIDFVFAILSNDYYKIKRGIITNKFDIYFHKDLQISIDLFLVEGNISIFRKIEDFISEDVFVGGQIHNAIKIENFLELIYQFPNQ